VRLHRSIFAIAIVLIFLFSPFRTYTQSNYLNSANAALKQQDFQRAEELYAKAEEHCGETTKVKQNTAVLLGLQGNFDEAIPFIDDAISKDADNPELYFNRALLFLKSGDFLSAIDDFQKASKLGGQRNSKSERHAVGLKRQSEEKQAGAKSIRTNSVKSIKCKTNKRDREY